MAAKFTSASTDDWRTLAEGNRLTALKPSEKREALQGTTSSQVKEPTGDNLTQPNVFGAKNLAIVTVLLAAGYIVDGALSGKRVDGSKGGPFRRMIDAILSPLRQLTGRGSGSGGVGWKQRSPAEMARLAAEKRTQTGGNAAGGKKKKKKGKRKQ